MPEIHLDCCAFDIPAGTKLVARVVATPAVLNAVYTATGKPVRSLPLKNVKLV